MSDSFTNEAFTLLSLGILIISCRVAARIWMIGVRKLAFDDYLMTFVAMVYSFETATAYMVGNRFQGLANNGMTDNERAALDLSSHEASLRRGGSKAQVVGWCLYTLVLWLLKVCMNACYSRVTYQLVYLESRIKVGWAIIGTTYLVVLLTILLGCQPFTHNWQMYPNPGNHCQPAVSKLNCYVVLFLNIMTDMWLISIPVPMLWKSQIQLKQKIGLTVLFGAGIFVMIAGVIRCVIILSNPATGAEQAGNWAVRESFVAVVIGNLPMIYPVLHRGVKRFASSQRSRYNLSGNGSRRFEMGGGARKTGGSSAMRSEHQQAYIGHAPGLKSSRRTESFATDDSRGRIVVPGFGKDGAVQRTIEADVLVEDAASACEIANGFVANQYHGNVH